MGVKVGIALYVKLRGMKRLVMYRGRQNHQGEVEFNKPRGE